MNVRDTDFETWFDTLVVHVLERTGVTFRDSHAVKPDYEEGLSVWDVIDEIVDEYGEVD